MPQEGPSPVSIGIQWCRGKNIVFRTINQTPLFLNRISPEISKIRLIGAVFLCEERHAAVRLRQVKRPAAAGGLSEWEDQKHLPRRKECNKQCGNYKFQNDKKISKISPCVVFLPHYNRDPFGLGRCSLLPNRLKPGAAAGLLTCRKRTAGCYPLHKTLLVMAFFVASWVWNGINPFTLIMILRSY